MKKEIFETTGLRSSQPKTIGEVLQDYFPFSDYPLAAAFRKHNKMDKYRTTKI